MFSSTNYVFIIGKTSIKLLAAHSLHGPKPSIDVLFEGDWSTDNIPVIVTQVKEKTGMKNASIIISDEIAYVATTGLANIADKTESELKMLMDEKAMGIFPEKKDDVVWDYKIGYTDGEKTYFQIAGVSKVTILSINAAFEHAGVTVDSIEPLSFALAQQLRANESANIVLHSDSSGFVIAFVNQGSVVVSGWIEPSNLGTEVKRFLGFMQSKGLVDERVTLVPSIGTDIAPIRSILDEFKVNVDDEKIIHPAMGIPNHKELKGKDSEVLNIAVKNQQKISDSDIEAAQDSDKKSFVPGLLTNKMFYMLAVLVLLVGTAVYMILFRAEPEEDNVAETEVAIVEDSEMSGDDEISQEELAAEPQQALENLQEVSPPVVEEVVEEELDLSDYSVNILNGSGTAGEAGKVSELLTEKGFSTINTGNADAYTYTKTEVRFKPGLADQLTPTINETLFGYVVEYPSDTLAETGEYDIEIIIGRETAQITATEEATGIPDEAGNAP